MRGGLDMKASISSIGSGNTMVEPRSLAMSKIAFSASTTRRYTEMPQVGLPGMIPLGSEKQ